jgi:hypothetical protein
LPVRDAKADRRPDRHALALLMPGDLRLDARAVELGRRRHAKRRSVPWRLGVRFLGLFAILILASQALAGCAGRTDDEALAVQDFIDSCSPFNAIDGDRHLEVKSRLVGLEQGRLKFANYIEITDPHEKPVKVDYTINDAEGTLTLKTRGGDVTYHTAELTGSACALLAGDPKMANINASWFAEKDDD